MSFRFNDELLLSDEDRALAERSFPNVFFALDHPELREEFQRVDKLAVEAKRRSRWIGCAALIFATLSLLAFPFDVIVKGIWIQEEQQEPILRYLAIAGACFGILALIFGNLGLGFGKVKRDWLMKRLITERLRQWHAQHIAAHAIDIAAADSAEKVAAVLDQRDLSFRRFKRSFIDQVSSEYTKYTQSSAASYSGQSVTNARSETAFWIDEAWPKKAAMKSDSVDPARLDEVYRALQETRIRGQIQYTNYVLSSEGKFWSSPSKQLHILGNLSYLLVVFAFAANFIALGAALWEPFKESTSVLSAVAIAFAILAVGVRAMLEGLRPQRETRRMQFYAAAINHADQSFETARTHARKIAAMSLLERASYDEMIEFISSNERARFVL
ncbi:MAG: hypothetical protein HRT82_05195 [Henriciella sp.]|nr:hypothetical protein [Henriciella sp.]